MNLTRRRAVSLALAALLAATLLYYSVRGVEWSQVGRILRNANFPLLLACGLISTLTLFLRAVRWRFF